MIKVLELFAGIGACTKALERLGIEHEVVDAVEIDKYAIASYNAIHGTNFEPQDITQWNKKIEADLIMHGSPCQDISLAGNQEGADEGSGTRSSLMYETLRIVEQIKPKYVIWENVKNLLSKKHIHNFNKYLDKMKELGYNSYYEVLNAKDYGIPQNRERVFTVSIRNDIDNHSFLFPQKQELNIKLKDMLEDEVDEKYYLSDKMIDYIRADNDKWSGNNDKSLVNKTIASAINTGEGSRRCDASNYISDELEENSNIKPNKALLDTLEKYKDKELQENQYLDAYNQKIRDDGITGTLTTKVDASDVSYILVKNKTKQGYLEATEGDGINISSRMHYQRGTVQKETCQTLDTKCNVGVVVKDVYGSEERKLFTEDGNIKRYINSDIVDEFKEGQMATTSFPNGYGHGPRTHDESVALNTLDKPSVKHNLRIRKLTPKECYRLMGFDDKDYEKASQVCSSTQLYKQAGNSIVVNVLEGILKNLLEVDHGDR